MSTPLGHNAILAASVKKALDDYNVIWKVSNHNIKEAFYRIMSMVTGYYNYPDAIQAIPREDGNILSRRVTHFECPKDLNGDSNYHKPFTASFLRKITESDYVKDEDYFDTCDQDECVMGQMSDFVTIDRKFNQLLSPYGCGSNDLDEYIMVKFALIHYKGVDRLNDLLFRRFITENDDGSLTINSVTYAPSEKKAVFGPLKSVIMDAQEQIAQIYLADTFPECDYERLNDAITDSYNFAYSSWLAENTLKYVKPIGYINEPFKPINDSYLRIPEFRGRDHLFCTIHDFVHASVMVTNSMIQDLFYPDFDTTMEAMFEF